MSSENEGKVCKWGVPRPNIGKDVCETWGDPVPTKAEASVRNEWNPNTGNVSKYETRFCTVGKDLLAQQECSWFDPLVEGGSRTIVDLIHEAGEKQKSLRG